MRFWKILLNFNPDGGDGAGGGTPPAPAKDDGNDDKKGKAKSVADEMKELQAAHDKEVAALKRELDEEKAQHAKDLREKLLHGSGDGNNDEKTAAQKIYETMKKKYGN